MVIGTILAIFAMGFLVREPRPKDRPVSSVLESREYVEWVQQHSKEERDAIPYSSARPQRRRGDGAERGHLV
jgi:hypothetical protein